MCVCMCVCVCALHTYVYRYIKCRSPEGLEKSQTPEVEINSDYVEVHPVTVNHVTRMLTRSIVYAGEQRPYMCQTTVCVIHTEYGLLYCG